MLHSYFFLCTQTKVNKVQRGLGKNIMSSKKNPYTDDSVEGWRERNSILTKKKLPYNFTYW